MYRKGTNRIRPKIPYASFPPCFKSGRSVANFRSIHIRTNHGEGMPALVANYRRAGIGLFVLAYFARSPGEVQAMRGALGLPLRVALLTVPPPVIQRRLADNLSSGRRDDLRQAASAIAASAGTGVEDVAIRTTVPSGS